MYTKCPECRTTFNINQEQLAARDGLVRCGKCTAVFRADRHLIEALPDNEPAPEDVSDTADTPARKSAHPGRRRAATAPAASRRVKKSQTDKADTTAPGADIPTVTDLGLLGKGRSRTRPFFWALGCLLLLGLLAGQFTYYYRDELALNPTLHPLVAEFCRRLECEIRPPRDVRLIELTQTTIAPHPKYENALRIRATLVNRAPRGQPYPLMEVSLTDSAGQVVARRAFAPREYLGPARAASNSLLSPNVLVNTLLDVTAPNDSATGYEIRLLAP